MNLIWQTPSLFREGMPVSRKECMKKRTREKWLGRLSYCLLVFAYLICIANYIVQANKESYKDMLIVVGILMLLFLDLEIPRYVSENKGNTRKGLASWITYWFLTFCFVICCGGLVFAPIGTAMFYYSDKSFPLLVLLYSFYENVTRNSNESEEERGNEE